MEHAPTLNLPPPIVRAFAIDAAAFTQSSTGTTRWSEDDREGRSPTHGAPPALLPIAPRRARWGAGRSSPTLEEELPVATEGRHADRPLELQAANLRLSNASSVQKVHLSTGSELLHPDKVDFASRIHASSNGDEAGLPDLSVVLMLDTSKSMDCSAGDGKTALHRAKEAFAKLVERLADERSRSNRRIELAVFLFANAVYAVEIPLVSSGADEAKEADVAVEDAIAEDSDYETRRRGRAPADMTLPVAYFVDVGDADAVAVLVAKVEAATTEGMISTNLERATAVGCSAASRRLVEHGLQDQVSREDSEGEDASSGGSKRRRLETNPVRHAEVLLFTDGQPTSGNSCGKQIKNMVHQKYVGSLPVAISCVGLGVQVQRRFVEGLIGEHGSFTFAVDGEELRPAFEASCDVLLKTVARNVSLWEHIVDPNKSACSEQPVAAANTPPPLRFVVEGETRSLEFSKLLAHGSFSKEGGISAFETRTRSDSTLWNAALRNHALVRHVAAGLDLHTLRRQQSFLPPTSVSFPMRTVVADSLELESSEPPNIDPEDVPELIREERERIESKKTLIAAIRRASAADPDESTRILEETAIFAASQSTPTWSRVAAVSRQMSRRVSQMSTGSTPTSQGDREAQSLAGGMLSVEATSSLR